MKSATKEGLDALEARRKIFLQNLATLYGQVSIKTKEVKEIKFYRDSLAGLWEMHDDLYKKIDEANDAQAWNKLRHLNRDSIALNMLLAKVGIKVAGMFVNRRSGLPNDKMTQNAAIKTLDGVLNNLIQLETELHYRVERLRARKKIQQFETSDHLGNLIRTFRLKDLDVEIQPAVSKDEDPKVTIRQHRWINAHITLDQIRLRIKRGEISRAKEKLEMLAALYKQQRMTVIERYQDIVSEITALRRIIDGLPDAHAPPKDVIEDVSRRIKSIVSLIKFPKQVTIQEIEYASIEKALRGQIHTLAGCESDYAIVMRNKTNLEYYAGRLAIAVKKGRLSRADRQIILKGLDKVFQWTGDGKVKPKQFAHESLKPVMGFIGNNDFTAAKKNIGKAAEYLEDRITTITGMVPNVKSRAASIYNKVRDLDMQRRLDNIQEILSKKDYEGVELELQELEEKYFETAPVEPGYKRIAVEIRMAQGILRGLKSLKNTSSIGLTSAKLRERIDIIKDDITHKRSFRVNIIPASKKLRTIFINPGTTFGGLFNILGRSKDEELNRVPGQFRYQGDPQNRVPDPCTIDLGRSARAGGDAQYHDEGPGTENDKYREQGNRPEAWTAEQVANIPIAIKRLYDSMVDLNHRSIAGDTTPETARLLKDVFGIARTGKALCSKASAVYKTWDEALRAAKLDPEKIRKHPAGWTVEEKSKIHEAIRYLYDNGVDLNATAISTDTAPETSQLLKKVLGTARTGGALYQQALPIYTSWDNALIAGGLDPGVIRINNGKWSDGEIAKIPDAINDLYDNGVDLNAVAIFNDTSSETTRLLEEVFGIDRTGRGLYRQASKAYGDWDNALIASGFASEDIRIRFDWTDEVRRKIPDAIKEL
ncbi:MAG: hypothetical protein NTY34_02815 [Candidatus Omnitrophica bacterium]|nr:hypothetical protein [Candidatus Omnitrophota bacterium]